MSRSFIDCKLFLYWQARRTVPVPQQNFLFTMGTPIPIPVANQSQNLVWWRRCMAYTYMPNFISLVQRCTLLLLQGKIGNFQQILKRMGHLSQWPFSWWQLSKEVLFLYPVVLYVTMCQSSIKAVLPIGRLHLRYNKIKFVCLSVPSNRPQFPSDLHQTWHAASV